nr:MAG TPA: hypothetical protein [Caudoviricetes sp.]
MVILNLKINIIIRVYSKIMLTLSIDYRMGCLEANSTIC